MMLAEDYVSPNNPALKYKLENEWIIWKQMSHDCWEMVTVISFKTIAGFWTTINGLELDGEHNAKFVMMKKGSYPEWDTLEYRNGGFYSIFVDSDNMKESADVFVNCLLGLVGGNLFSSKFINSSINGVSCVFSNKSRQLKFWSTSSIRDVHSFEIHDSYKNAVAKNISWSNYTSFYRLKNKNHFNSYKTSNEVKQKAG